MQFFYFFFITKKIAFKYWKTADTNRETIVTANLLINNIEIIISSIIQSKIYCFLPFRYPGLLGKAIISFCNGAAYFAEQVNISFWQHIKTLLFNYKREYYQVMRGFLT